MLDISVTGIGDLTKKLAELGDPKAQAATLRAAVGDPMRQTMKVAKANVGRISPGKTPLHKTYRGRMVSAGFASRSIRTKVSLSRDKQKATARGGVLREAFYALQFFELGTAHIPRQPWMLPAFQASKDAMIKKMAETMKKRIDRIAAKRSSG